MDANKSVTANFSPVPTQYLLFTSVNPSGGGTVLPDCSAGCWRNAGTPVTITASPATGYQFTSFTGVDSSSGSVANVVMNANRAVTVNFTQTPTSYSLTTSVTPAGSGTLTFSPPCCTYHAGTQVTITAIAANGYQFSGWTGSVNSSSNPVTVTMNSGMAETANFTQITMSQPLTASPSSQSVAPTGVAGYAITVGANSGFNGVVTFGASRLPTGATANFNPPTVSTSGTVSLNISTSAASPTGTFPILENK